MNNKYIVTLTLVLLLAIALPASAAPRAKATATVSARVLEPVSLTITQELKQNRLLPDVKVSSAQKLAYQLQVNNNSIHSYSQSAGQVSQSMQLAMHKVGVNKPATVSVTLNFN